ncbi:MAG: hypothetical protein GY810_24780 [Aureispira sp.]|nr:hypothetical protein [Aureispira sp.]
MSEYNDILDAKLGQNGRFLSQKNLGFLAFLALVILVYIGVFSFFNFAVSSSIKWGIPFESYKGSLIPIGIAIIFGGLQLICMPMFVNEAITSKTLKGWMKMALIVVIVEPILIFALYIFMGGIVSILLGIIGGLLHSYFKTTKTPSYELEDE